tara:strand:+ start:771 stop:1529 length:759 start_codon:yes stop_codon:yes gene_type:complete
MACDRCAQDRVVYASYATNAVYATHVRHLADSIVRVARAPCVCMGHTEFAFAAARSVQPVKLDASRFPLGPYCAKMSGWRIVHFLKPSLIVALLEAGHGVFSIDADWTMRAALAPLPMHDVVALADRNPPAHYLNVGMMYLRRTDVAVHTWRRIANRSYAAWDQSVANEEIAASSASCCSWSGFVASFSKNGKIHAEKARDRGSSDPSCATRTVRVLEPPNNMSYPQWRVNDMNFDNLHRTKSRCSSVCAGV